VNAASGFVLFGSVIVNDTSSSFNPAGPNQTPIPGNFLVSAPLSCSFAPASLVVSPCSLATLSVTPSTGLFSFSVASNPSAVCPGNYSVVERCLEAGGSLSACRPLCFISYGYRLTETTGPGLSSSALLSFGVVPPVAHVSVTVTAVPGVGPFVPGDNATFVVRLFNAGPEAASSVVVRLGVAAGLLVQNSTVSLPLWTVATLSVGGTAEAVISTRVTTSADPYVVTALIQSLTEFDFSVLDHFALARVLVALPSAPIAPNQTFATTNSSCASLNVLGCVHIFFVHCLITFVFVVLLWVGILI
jgi:hypothetical protein